MTDAPDDGVTLNPSLPPDSGIMPPINPLEMLIEQDGGATVPACGTLILHEPESPVDEFLTCA